MASPDKFFFNIGANINVVSKLSLAGYDGVVLVTYPESFSTKAPSPLGKIVQSAVKLDKGLETVSSVLECPDVAGSRLIVSPTGPISPYDDCRSVHEAAKKGILRAIKAGVKSPILVLQDVPEFKNSSMLIILGAFEGLYVPLQVRDSGKLNKIDNLGIYGDNIKKDVNSLLKLAIALEESRQIARDVAGGDPERMSPPNVEAYVREVFASDTNIKLSVQHEINQLEKEYPLFAAVNRAAHEIPRHRGRIIFLEYTPEDASKITDTVMLVGKGVTYDTGGADVKYGGSMPGMSRDKSGGAAVIGFMKLVALVKPKHLKVISGVPLVRNSIGENCYVADELIIARSGKRIRIGNTDAEGRMIMADVLCLMKEKAKKEVNPHLYTVATLTGHSVLACGVGYNICVDNHYAKVADHGKKFQESGDEIADPVEISTMRRDDLLGHRGTFEGDDALQCTNEPSTRTSRGHQKPAAFLLIAAGLEDEKLKYSHIDMAPSAGIAPEEPTASPLLALANLYKLIN